MSQSARVGVGKRGPEKQLVAGVVVFPNKIRSSSLQRLSHFARVDRRGRSPALVPGSAALLRPSSATLSCVLSIAPLRATLCLDMSWDRACVATLGQSWENPPRAMHPAVALANRPWFLQPLPCPPLPAGWVRCARAEDLRCWGAAGRLTVLRYCDSGSRKARNCLR